MNKIFSVSGLFICELASSVLGTQVPFKTLLQTAIKDPVVISQDQNVAFVEKTFLGIPGIEDIELQVRNTGFDPDNFRYSLQIKPRGILESRAAGKYNKALICSKKSKRNYLLNIAIYNRYLLFIDLLEQKTLKGLYQQLLTLYDDRIKVMENLSYSEDFQMEDLIKEENDRSKEVVFSLEIEKFISVLEQRARAYLNDTTFTGFDTTDIVSIKTIMNRIENTEFSLDTNNAYFELYRKRLELAKTRYNMEKAQNHRFFDMVGFTFDNGDLVDEYNRRNQSKDYDLNNAYAIEVGLKIPNLTLASHELNKFKADLLSETENYEQVREELSEKVRKDLADLRQLIAQYRYLSARENEVDAEASLKKFLQIDGIDPLILLEIKENIIKNQIKITFIKYGIMRNYLYVIDNAGLLSVQPIRNYLSEDQELIQ